MPPLTDLIGQSAEAGLPLGNSWKQAPSPPPPCLPPWLSRARSLARLLFPAPSGRPTFRSWPPSTARASPQPEPRLEMRPAERCAQPAQGRAREHGWRRKKAGGGAPASLLSRVSPAPCGERGLEKRLHDPQLFSVGGGGRGGAKGCAWAAYLVIPRASCGQSGVLVRPLPTTPTLQLRGCVPLSCGWSTVLAPPASTPAGRWDPGGHQGSQEGRAASRH